MTSLNSKILNNQFLKPFFKEFFSKLHKKITYAKSRDEELGARARDFKKRDSRHVSRPRPSLETPSLQPAPAVNMSKLQAHHFMTLEQRTYLLCNVSYREIKCYCKN